MPTLQSHTYYIRTMSPADQKCGKSVPVPTLEEFQNIFSSASKKLKHPTHKPTRQRHGNSMMTMVWKDVREEYHWL